jgi:hypothetical protein
MPPKTSKWNTSFCYNRHAPGKPVHPRQRGTSVRRAEQEVISISENDKKTGDFNMTDFINAWTWKLTDDSDGYRLLQPGVYRARIKRFEQ